MARRDNPITVYVDDALYDEVETRADDAEMSISGFVTRVLEQHVRDQLAVEIDHQTAVERRLEELAANAAAEITDAVAGFEAAMVQTGVYSVATWELVKSDFGDVKRRQAIQAGSNRMREEADVLGIDLDPATGGSGTPDRSTGPDHATGSNPPVAGSDPVEEANDSDSADDGDWYY